MSPLPQGLEKAHAPSAATRLWRKRLAWIMAAALLLRLGVGAALLLIEPSVGTPPPETDMASYMKMARAIVAGDFQPPFYYQPFYYSVFLIPLVLLPEVLQPWAILLVQALLGLAVISYSARAAALLFNRRAALIAAVLIAVCQQLVTYTAHAYLGTLLSFLCALFTWLLLRAWRQGGLSLWLAAAAVLALATLTRGNASLFFPVLAIALILRERRRLSSWPRALTMAAAAWLMFQAVQFPHAWINHRAAGGWPGPSTAFHAVLPYGNTPDAPPCSVADTLGYKDWVARHESANPAINRSCLHSLLDFMRTQPLVYAELKFRALLFYFSPRNMANNINSAYLCQQAPWLQVLPPDHLLLALGLGGLLLALNRRPRHGRHRLLIALSIVGVASVVGFYVLERFRLPQLPLWTLWAGFGLDALWRPHLRRQAITALALGSFGVYAILPIYQNNLEPAVHRAIQPHGVFFELLSGPAWQSCNHMENKPWIGLSTHGAVRAARFKIPPEVAARFQGHKVCVYLSLVNPELQRPLLLATQVNGVPGPVASVHIHSSPSRHPVFAGIIPPQGLSLEAAILDSKSASIPIDTSRDNGFSAIVLADGTQVPVGGEFIVHILPFVDN